MGIPGALLGVQQALQHGGHEGDDGDWILAEDAVGLLYFEWRCRTKLDRGVVYQGAQDDV